MSTKFYFPSRASQRWLRVGPLAGDLDRFAIRLKAQGYPKQRHTAKRIFERLRDEHGFTGGYTIVKDYVREHHHRRREMFVPLTHPPGHAQADFGEAWAVIAGVKQKGTHPVKAAGREV